MDHADLISDSCQEIERFIANAAFTPAVALLLDVCNTLCPEMRGQAISLSRRYHALRRAAKAQLSTDDSIGDIETDVFKLLQYLRTEPQPKSVGAAMVMSDPGEQSNTRASSPSQSEQASNAPPYAGSRNVPVQDQGDKKHVVSSPVHSGGLLTSTSSREDLNQAVSHDIQLNAPTIEEEKVGHWIEATGERRPSSDSAHKREQVVPQSADRPRPQTIISCEHVSKRYRSSNFNLMDLSLELRRGHITALVGVNGSGKTTFLRILLGEIAQDRGTIRYFLSGREETDWWHIKRQIGYMPQQSLRWPGSLRSYLLYVSAMHSENARADGEQVEWHLHRYGLLEYAAMSWYELSGGYRTRAQLARALLTQPKLLVLDEPLAYLDIVAQDIFLSDLRSLCSDVGRGVPVLITSQHISEIEGIADEIVVLDEGKCRFSGPVRKLWDHSDGYYFEISPRFPGDSLMRIFGKLGLEHVGEMSNGNLLCFNKQGDHSAIFSAISDRLKDEVLSVRNITGSAKRMFRDRSDEF